MKFAERDLVIGLAALVGGIVSAIVVALPLEVLFGLHDTLVGIIEEPAKVIAIIFLAFYSPDWLVSKKKCAIFGGLAGLGFAFTENLLYYMGLLASEELSSEVIYGRTFLSLPFHIFDSAMVGMGLLYIAAKGKEGYKNAMGLLFVAILLHGLWNAVSILGWYILMLIMVTLIFDYIYKKLPEYPIPDEQIGVLRFPKRDVWITRERIFGRNDFRDDTPFEDLQHISRKHFNVTRFGDKFFIEDCISEGGTRLNGIEIQGKGKLELSKGSVITLPAGLSLRFLTKVDVENVMEMPTLTENKGTRLLTSEAVMPAQLVLPNNSEIKIRDKEKEFGREDFKNAISEEKIRFISRRQFKITSSYGEFYIEDSESNNGTMLNGEEIKGLGKRKMVDGDEILVAKILNMRFIVVKVARERGRMDGQI